MTETAVPFDAEIEPIVAAMAPPGAPPVQPADLPQLRRQMNQMNPPTEEVIGDRAVVAQERIIPGPAADPDLQITILAPTAHGATAGTAAGAVPALYNIHGGGMMMGHRSMDTPRLVDLVEELGVVAVNVEYRLAPEHPHPAPSEDCFAGLEWLAAHAEELGVDPGRIVVMGGSAGGGLSAAVALMARDRGGPVIAGQLLLCPMIDDTNTTTSSHQYAGLGTWPREMNLVGWRALLGESHGGEAVSVYAAPTRADDLSGLPPAFIEAGSAEMFRDENVDYATRIWATGGEAELHVLSGGCHGFDIYAPEAEITRAALAARTSWLRRVLYR